MSLTAALWVIGCCTVMMVWVVSGRSPFVWLAWLSLHVEAVRVETIHSVGLALKAFAANYGRTAGRVRTESFEERGFRAQSGNLARIGRVSPRWDYPPSAGDARELEALGGN